MNVAKYAIDFAMTSAIVLVVSVLMTFLYSLILHGSGIVDWESSIRFAIILGIVLPFVQQRQARKTEQQ